MCMCIRSLAITIRTISNRTISSDITSVSWKDSAEGNSHFSRTGPHHTAGALPTFWSPPDRLRVSATELLSELFLVNSDGADGSCKRVEAPALDFFFAHWNDLCENISDARPHKMSRFIHIFESSITDIKIDGFYLKIYHTCLQVFGVCDANMRLLRSRACTLFKIYCVNFSWTPGIPSCLRLAKLNRFLFIAQHFGTIQSYRTMVTGI